MGCSGPENRYAIDVCKNMHTIEENRGATEACGENRHATEENRNGEIEMRRGSK